MNLDQETSITIVLEGNDPVEALVAAMASAWRQGETVAAEEWLRRYPQFSKQPEAAIRLVYEEYCLRQELGLCADPREFLQRFPQWAEELSILLDCHRLLRTPSVAPIIPNARDRLGGFLLVAELGCGADGTVFLAKQEELADRPVVLKVTTSRLRETQSLARLQHTHIIPLHAVYDFPKRGLQAMCMPYLGGATLDKVLIKLRHVPRAKRTGLSIVHALDEAQPSDRALPRGGKYVRDWLSKASYADAVCYLGACLGDGLQFAHEHDLLHLDVKPSNVLLAADGQPLLLDFHLAIPPVRVGQTTVDHFGGTPGFMSPEQERVASALTWGQPIREGVDARSDVYSLGKLLTTLLTDEGPGKAESGYVPVSVGVSVGLQDILRKATDAKPERRYASASLLATDLRLHLAHRPLKGVRNRSVFELWRKWHQRRPNAALWMGLFLALVAGGLFLGFAFWERHREIHADLLEGRERYSRREFAEAMQIYRRGQARADSLAGLAGSRSLFDGPLHEAQQALAAKHLHEVAEQVRFLSGAPLESGPGLTSLEKLVGQAWQARPTEPWLEHEATVREDLLEIALFRIDLRKRRGGPPEKIQEEIAGIVAETESLVGANSLLDRVRNDGSGSTRESPLRRPTEIAFGLVLLREGKYDEARQVFEGALAKQPNHFWARFHQGVCAYRQEKYQEAVHAFDVALALTPTAAEVYFNRARALLALGKSSQALEDFSHAIEHNSKLGAAYAQRGELHLNAGRFAESLRDFQAGLERGADPAKMHYLMAFVHFRVDDLAASRRSFALALRENPSLVDRFSLRRHLGDQ